MIGDFVNLSSEYFGNQQIRNMTPRLPPAVMEAGCQQQNFSPERSSNSIMSPYDFQAGSSFCSHYSKSYDSHPSSGPNYSIDIGEQSDHSYGLNSNLESGIAFQFLSKEIRDRQVRCSPYNSPFAGLSFNSREGKQSPGFSLGGGPTSSGKDLPSKTRIRWTQDLHEKFVECVNRLGGAEKATPKAILKLMDSDGLTIFHVKSHLQKYRIAKYMPDPSEGKAEKRTSINDVSQLDIKTGFQIREALQLQLDVQRRLHEQLEIQRNLQLRIEEQRKQLKMMFDQQQKTTNSLLNNQNLDITSLDDPTFSLEDIDVSILAGSDNNTHFPSKIS
ncbi:hypothetical protein OIU77_030853 [Salix suchowensis]|uniref:HTH myb-type domain-containing protein n=1 Tax=Salix suchowensis TaxID=1278906 RepID=A0ABQ9BG19_9ROSI|nr:hypothetical protein OIU77_030853 [Salix suchowensis]